MLPIEAELYLPVSESTLSVLLDDTSNWDTTLATLGIPEIASLFVLAHLPTLGEHRNVAPERVLATSIESCCQQVDNSSLPQLIEYALQHLDHETINCGFHLLSHFKIGLLDDEEVKRKAYISHTGHYDYGFQSRYRESLNIKSIRTSVNSRPHSLSAEQSRVYREFEAQKDEHLHIQGYAGTGKTSLMKTLLTMFGTSNAKVLVLAARKIQLDALRLELKNMPHVHTATYIDLANKLIPADINTAANKNMRDTISPRATMSDEAIIRQLGVRAIGTHSSNQLIMAIRATVYRFCQSTDTRILEKHIPATHVAMFDATLRAVVHHYACNLWQALLLPPTKDFKPPIRGYHKIKWAALHGWQIPAQYSHVMVDECHDLPQPILQILARSPQARSTLGDDYQNLSGRTVRQTDSIRVREMVHSVRSGDAVDPIINKIIAVHPSNMKAQFKGNKLSTLKIITYQKPAIPDTPALILVNDNWGLFEWVQRLASQNISATLKSNRVDLNRFVQDCFELKNGGSSVRHGELFRYKSWDELADACKSSSGFRRFNQLLEKGYGQKNWEQTYSRLHNAPDKRPYVISQIENVRNLEYDNVMLTPDIFESADKMSKAAFSASMYVCITRARQRLIAPEKLNHWIEQISEAGLIDHKSSRRSPT